MIATSANRRLAAGAKQDTAEVLVRPFPATRGRADGFCGTGAMRCVGQWQRRVLGWPELGCKRGWGSGAQMSEARCYKGSTRCGERVGRMPGTKWSPERHRRRAQAVAGAVKLAAVVTACEEENGEGENDQ